MTGCQPFPRLRFHVSEPSLLREGEGHHVRRDEPDAGIEARDEIGPDVGNRQATGFRKLLCDHSERNVALPEDCAARLWLPVWRSQASQT